MDCWCGGRGRQRKHQRGKILHTTGVVHDRLRLVLSNDSVLRECKMMLGVCFAERDPFIRAQK
jgi:hypothetical protein